MADAVFDAWGLPARDARGRKAGLLAISMGVIAGVIGAGGAALFEVTPWLGVALGVVIIAAHAGTRSRAALRRSGAKRISGDSQPRLASLVAGLARDLDIKPPATWMYDGAGPNALVCRAGGGAIAVSSAAISVLNRTELEALVAHCLARLATGATRAATVASMGRLVAMYLGAIVTTVDDARCAALTRYPPAVGGALQKCDPQSGRFAPFYVVGAGPSHAPVNDRIAALTDL
jgi:hypothetical protein